MTLIFICKTIVAEGMMNYRYALFAGALFLIAAALLAGCDKGDDDTSSTRSSDDDDVVVDDDYGDDDDDGHWGDDTSSDDDDDDLEFPEDTMDTGPYGVGVRTMFFSDPTSESEVGLMAVYPSADEGGSIDDSAGDRPILIFGPGLLMENELYLSYTRHLASWGYVVVMRANFTLSHLQLALTTNAIIDWLNEQQETSGSLFEHKLNMLRVGALGHALGGKIALLAAKLNTNIFAVAGIDPDDSLPTLPIPYEDYPSVTPELMPNINIPTLFIGSELGGDCVPAEENYQQYYEHANSPSEEITVLFAGLTSFLDNPSCGVPCASCDPGTADHDNVQSLTRRYITAFFNVTMLDEDQYQKWLTGAGMTADTYGGFVTSLWK
jgi:hypothetical protein